MEHALREVPYPITGATKDEIRRAIAVLGPLRGGIRYAAFTDWEVIYRVRPLEDPRLTVAVSAVVRMPELHAPRSISPEILEAWGRYIEALRCHEMGHVAIARAAGQALFEALLALPGDAAPARIDHVARASIAFAHAKERAYDAETRHGATQGAVLFGSLTPPLRLHP